MATRRSPAEVRSIAMSQLTETSLLGALRAGEQSARSALAHDGHQDDNARRATARDEVVRELAAQLVPTDRPLVRWLLEQEAASVRAAGRGVTETLYTLVAALARFGQPEDALPLWRAHEATPETRAGIDVEQLLRADPERVRLYLGELAHGQGALAHEARAALAWIEAGIADGAATDLPGYFYWADERFGLQVTGPTCRFNGPAACADLLD